MIGAAGIILVARWFGRDLMLSVMILTSSVEDAAV